MGLEHIYSTSDLFSAIYYVWVSTQQLTKDIQVPNLPERNALTEKEDRNEKTKICRSPLSQFSQLKKMEIIVIY